MTERLTKTLVPGGHVFVVDQDIKHPLGVIKNFNMGDPHSGPRCVKCEQYFCENCNDDVWTEQCPDQDETLPGLEFG